MLGVDPDQWQELKPWSESLVPFLHSVTGSLRSLHLMMDSSWESLVSLDPLVKLRFPSLKDLHLSGFNMTVPVAKWLQMHPQLQTLELDGVRAADGNTWRELFVTLRQHPCWKQINACGIGPNNYEQSFRVTTDGPDSTDAGSIAVYNYLHNLAPWSQELDDLFGETDE